MGFLTREELQDANADLIATRDELLGELEAILNDADLALTRLQLGESTTGTSSLLKVKDRARDAIRHHHEDHPPTRAGRAVHA